MLSLKVIVPYIPGIDQAKLQQALASGIYDATLLVNSRAKQNAPVLSGTLRRGIIAEFPRKTTGFVGISLSRVPYAAIQEFGGRTGRGGRTVISPKHYLTRAMNDSERKVQDIIHRKIKKFLESK